MTVVLGILNKQAVAIAADSAVTIGGPLNHKIFNRANKVFTLSKFHPVGIMLYNSATFMTTPWETIIKVYRKQLNNISFPTIKHYQEDFVSFLKNKHCFSTEEEQRRNLFEFSYTIINEIVRVVINSNKSLFDNPTEDNKNQILNLIEQKSDELINQLITSANFCEDFIDYPYEDFQSFIAPFYEVLIIQNFTNNGYLIGESLKEKLRQLVHLYLKSKETFSVFSGLVFTGFGDEEIYPSLIPINISLSVQNRVRFYVDEGSEAHITNENTGAIRPFAQTDVINTILTGIDPMLDITYLENFGAYFKKYNDYIINLIGDNNPLLSAQISNVNIADLVKEYNIKNLETKQTNYIFPLMNAVSSLSKEDLAEMAESLIYLTYLKRRITNAEESVGGPVDVAIISKGDGFIWIKRKHYFKPELNQYFFDNYFNT